MRFIFISFFTILFLSTVSTFAQEAGTNEHKKIKLTNGYEVLGTVMEITEDSTIVIVEEIRFAYHNSVVKSITKTEERRSKIKSQNRKKLMLWELTVSGGMFLNQDFRGKPSGAGSISIAARLAQDRIRIEASLGGGKISQTTTNRLLKFESGEPVESTYDAKINLSTAIYGLTVGFDFLTKKKSSLIVYMGGQMLHQIAGNYAFDYDVGTDSDLHSLVLQKNIYGGVQSGLTFGFLVSSNMTITFGYGFSYFFGKVRPVTNSNSNRMFYNDDFLAAILNDPEIEDFLVAVKGLNLNRLDLPNKIGGLHSFTIGYRYAFGKVEK